MSDEVMELVRRARGARSDGRIADARRDFVEALSLSRRSSDRRDLIASLRGRAGVERDLGYPDAARPLYEEAVELCREEGDPQLLAHALHHLGDLHRGSGRLAEAETAYLEALEHYRGSEHAREVEIANAIRALAILRGRQGSHAESRELWDEAWQLYVSAGVQPAVQECSAQLARLSEIEGGP